ncbi:MULTISPECIES: RNA polymerase sigma factor [Brochothrix]|uniref:RNA polymerase sigma factor n=1 Tax=Brochothrix TaxID=2755 RepID=UPI00083FC9EC|nr:MULTISPECIES: sigma-70 family RNA polymerase sigma factor [Brochothrix]ANZ96028.1 hypothetical protein BFC19_11825 [Brochothrix thermosphacta]MBR5526180.1 sigma-70 family RNA polymerase sigma factor [Brochothrix sp.]MDO7863227.1 sigma-70 family RNA polymerase sigma factor [Brochothrix thermosphacta]ODJ51994.1 hypothetical protein BFR38_03155 [Brochothrix thermosphacta]ODJ57318.1 hypothetical protein BFR41_01925 [Brochothrix thermosphacta]
MPQRELEKYYQTYYRELYLYAYSLSQHKQMAEDLVSETFYRALYGKQKYQEQYKYWLFRICKNLYIDEYRKKKRYQSKVPLLGQVVQGDNLDQFIEKERYQNLYRCVLALRSPHKEMIILHYFCDYQLNEVADYLEIPYSTVKVSLFRARQKLRKELEPYEKF